MPYQDLDWKGLNKKDLPGFTGRSYERQTKDELILSLPLKQP